MPELFDIVEQLSKSRLIHDGKYNEAIYEIISSASKAIKCQRVNVWLFENDFSEMKCIGNYDSSNPHLPLSARLQIQNLPHYFELLSSSKIVITNHAFENPQISELLEIYLIPNNIHSLMDIPIHIGGELVGLICFENTKIARTWTEQEQKFGLVIAQMISLALETGTNQKIKLELEAALAEQNVLLQEVNHRVKNNLAIIASLINIQSEKAKDDYHRSLFQETRNRLMSFTAVHELLYKSQSYSEVDVKKYLSEIINNLVDSIDMKNKSININKNIEELTLPVSAAIPLALILTELLTNSFKYAFKLRKSGAISIKFFKKNNMVTLIVADDGVGFDLAKVESSVGYEIMDALIQQIDATMTHENRNGSITKISFKK